MKHILIAALLASLTAGVNLSLAQELAKAPLTVSAEAKTAVKTKLNINKASLEQLVAIPGIGEKKIITIKTRVIEKGEEKIYVTEIIANDMIVL